MFSEIFFTFLITTSSGLLIGLFTILYKSKCTSVKLCGLSIDRDTVGELKEDELEFKSKIENKV
jgi:hypothetical protein